MTTLTIRRPASRAKAQFGLRVIAKALTTWTTRRQMRIALARLEDHQLFDIGVDRQAALTEIRKPFWRA